MREYQSSARFKAGEVKSEVIQSGKLDLVPLKVPNPTMTNTTSLTSARSEQRDFRGKRADNGYQGKIMPILQICLSLVQDTSNLPPSPGMLSKLSSNY